MKSIAHALCLATLLATVSVTSPLNAQQATDSSWPAVDPSVALPKPGEHPRILFRKSDVPALRQRASTPEGRAMVARLKTLLGGGESMPTVFNQNPVVNIGPVGPKTLPVGAFTFGHGVGFGFLYQMTGQQKYADLARACVEKIFAGQPDRDERYCWTTVGTGFRYSGTIQMVAITYDLCYDGWSPDFRQEVVRQLQTHQPVNLKGNKDPRCTLEAMAGGGKYPPSSNHYGAYLAGPAIVALALMGDEGVDTPRMQRLLETSENSLRTLLTQAYGDGGWFGEGSGADQTPMQPGSNTMIAALRTATGRDWSRGGMAANQRLLTRYLEWVKTADGVQRPPRGAYSHGSMIYDYNKIKDTGAGWSDDGFLSIGMGALAPEFRPGAMWIYNHFVEPGTPAAQRMYDAQISPYHAVSAYVNWPIGIPEENPAKTFPMAVHDSLHGYVICRNRFQDENDVVFTALARTGPTGYLKILASQNIWIWGMGMEFSAGSFSKEPVADWISAADGSASFRQGGVGYVFDASQRSGCDALIAIGTKRRIFWESLNRQSGESVPDDQINLTGRWTDGKVIGVTQTGNKIEARFSGKKPVTKHGHIEGRTLYLVWNDKKTLTATISDDAKIVDWGGGVWKQDIKPEQWKNDQDKRVRVEYLTVGGQDVTLLLFDDQGVSVTPKVSGSTITVGGQTITVEGTSLRLGSLTAN